MNKFLSKCLERIIIRTSLLSRLQAFIELVSIVSLSLSVHFAFCNNFFLKHFCFKVCLSIFLSRCIIGYPPLCALLSLNCLFVVVCFVLFWSLEICYYSRDSSFWWSKWVLDFWEILGPVRENLCGNFESHNWVIRWRP